jgi:hypothetical protein
MQVLLGAATLFFCCCRVAAFGSHDLALRTWVSGPRQMQKRLTVTDARTTERWSASNDHFYDHHQGIVRLSVCCQPAQQPVVPS